MKFFLYFTILLTIFTGKSFSEITYLEILKNPTDLKLNLQFAKEQEVLGNYKQVIATLERLSDIYPENLDLKLYLLSISLRIDSKERTKNILEDIKKNNELTAELRSKIKTITSTLEQENKISDKNAWVRYMDLGLNSINDSNVNTMSNTKTFYISDSLSRYALDTVSDDSYENIIVKTGAFKNLSKNSNINFNVGKNFIRQNKDKNKESDLHSLFVNYNKQFNNNTFSAFYSLNETNNIHNADYVVHSMILENRYNLKPNQNILFSGSYALTNYRTDSIFTTAKDKNNESNGFALGYEFFFDRTHHIKLKLGQSEYKAKIDSYGYQNNQQSITYTNNFKSINFSLSKSINSNEYDKIDTFVKTDSRRDDKITTDTFTVYGNFNKILESKNLDIFKDLSYFVSYSEIMSKSNILNYDYNKEIIKFGLTKRVMF